MNTYKILAIFFMYMGMVVVGSIVLGSFVGVLSSLATLIMIGKENVFFIGIVSATVTFLCGCCLGFFMALPQTIEDIKEERRKEHEDYETI